MPFDDRDPKFERALAQHLLGGAAQAACPDAETLAAYHERNLSIDEMARWKEHISACEACQEALALVETTENQLAEDWEDRPVPMVESLSIPAIQAANASKQGAQATASPVAILRRRPALLRWAIPLGAVAAGVLIFIGIYEQRAQKIAQNSDTVLARRETPATPAPMRDQPQSKVQEPVESKDKELATAGRSVQKKEKAILAAPSPRPAEGIGSGAGAGIVNGKLDDSSANKKAAAKPAPAPEISGGFQAGAGVGQNAPVRAAAPSAPPPPAPMGSGGVVGGVVSRQKATSDAKTVPPSVSQTVTVQNETAPLNGRNDTDSLMLKQGVSNDLAESAGSLNGLILTPNNRVFWKLQPAGTVQLTTDGGKDWKSLETGANEDLTTGFAPSSNVCWIAGRSGTLLLTKDRGTHWSRINTPIAGDLGGVHAADAKHASIWDSTRHTSYETSDGGSTWKQTTSQ
ncbi:MAG TPA: YCF48-related protein [Candidatus Baltobacteraceae bacterium]|nr:YCF48-related protein [Candidatus Baltobacteraceae bacterium]